MEYNDNIYYDDVRKPKVDTDLLYDIHNSIGLTPRQSTICTLLEQGDTKESIAEYLDLHVNTVYAECESIAAKMEACGIIEGTGERNERGG